MSRDITTYVEDLASEAKAASVPLGRASDGERVAAVRAMAAALRNREPEILAANAEDMDAARAAGTNAGLLDRLLLTPERMEGMAAGLEALADLPDPVGRVLERRTIDCGLDLTRVSVPLGLVAMVYEARPNVTADGRRHLHPHGQRLHSARRLDGAALVRSHRARARRCGGELRAAARRSEHHRDHRSRRHRCAHGGFAVWSTSSSPAVGRGSSSAAYARRPCP